MIFSLNITSFRAGSRPDLDSKMRPITKVDVPFLGQSFLQNPIGICAKRVYLGLQNESETAQNRFPLVSLKSI